MGKSFTFFSCLIFHFLFICFYWTLLLNSEFWDFLLHKKHAFDALNPASLNYSLGFGTDQLSTAKTFKCILCVRSSDIQQSIVSLFKCLVFYYRSTYYINLNMPCSLESNVCKYVKFSFSHCSTFMFFFCMSMPWFYIYSLFMHLADVFI